MLMRLPSTAWRGVTAGMMMAGLAATLVGQTPPAAAPDDARTWIGHRAEIEAYLRTVQIVKLQELSVGVTHPRKAMLAPGGLSEYLVWKVIPPNRYDGFWESYLSEIAAYELDKALELNMVPPTVEKEYRGDRGAAVMWAAPTKSFKEMGSKGAPLPPPRYAFEWARQIARAKMFDNLINNLDPNLGNWLVDPSWHLILIDHTRAFTPGTKMVHQMTHVDADLWTRMQALTEASLEPVLGKWVMRGEIKSIIDRRDRMAAIIAEMVKARGERDVFIHASGGSGNEGR